MSGDFIYDRKCDLGYGVDPVLKKFCGTDKPLECLEIKDINEHVVISDSVSLKKLPSIGLELLASQSPAIEAILDHLLILKENEFTLFEIVFYSKSKRGKKLDEYDESISHFIESISLGTNLRILIPSNFSNFEDYILEKKQVPETLKTTKFRVLVNWKTIQSLELSELINLVDSIKTSNYEQIPIFASFGKIKDSKPSNSRDVAYEKDLETFLISIFLIFRNIELKMIENKYENLSNFDFEGLTFVNICAILNTARNDFNNYTSETFDGFKVYEISKKLFFSYVAFLKSALEKKVDIKEAGDIPQKNLNTWIKMAQKWFPLKIGNSWVGCTEGILVTSNNNNTSITKLRTFNQFKDFQVIVDEKASEPYILNQNNEKIYFGFANIPSFQRSYSPLPSQKSKLRCPKKCTEDSRNWICSTCGEFLSLNLGECLQFQCSCGTQMFDVEYLTCAHPNHQKNTFEQPSSTANNDQDSKNLSLIKQQLSKLCFRVDSVKKNKIETALQNLSNSKENNKNILKSLEREVGLDGDTQYLVSNYCGN